MKKLVALSFVLFVMTAGAWYKPYDESADAKLDIKNALSQATTSHTPVIVIFGANWCSDCKMLDKTLKHGPSAALIARDFTIVKVDIGHYDKNVDIAESYGVPLGKGIPTLAIITTNDEVLYATRNAELADAQKMGTRRIYDFFKRVTASYVEKK